MEIRAYNPKFWAENVIGFGTKEQIKRAKLILPETMEVEPIVTKTNSLLGLQSVHNTVLQGRGRESALHRGIVEVGGKQYDVAFHPITCYAVNDGSDELYCKGKFVSLPQWIVHPDKFVKAKELQANNPLLAGMSVMEVFELMQSGKLRV